MAGTGPAPKPQATRARRNKTATNAVLRRPKPEDIDAPELPPLEDGWHGMTREWWRDIWRSPMAPEYDDSDIHGLYALALVVNDFWTAGTAKERQAASAEMRLQSVRFGLSPMDRRRLQWQIEETEAKQAAGQKRKAKDADQAPAAPPARGPAAGVDPRGILRSV